MTRPYDWSTDPRRPVPGEHPPCVSCGKPVTLGQRNTKGKPEHWRCQAGTAGLPVPMPPGRANRRGGVR
ncbi:hypothetical protein [Mycolicibacterium fortuitum]|uniref:hypothetical protein n=1 Tax=Mycolicibacterium fortuitum TaxID=1766 RepID=UPI000A835B7D|nr:hypothetical protein [Mycolicibacterium fortuitum]